MPNNVPNLMTLCAEALEQTDPTARATYLTHYQGATTRRHS
jgi:hypothetical protein